MRALESSFFSFFARSSLSHVITIFLNWVDDGRKYIHALGLFPLSLENLQGYSSIKEFSVPKNDAHITVVHIGKKVFWPRKKKGRVFGLLKAIKKEFSSGELLRLLDVW
mgnify:CR=1 FL=1